MSAWVATHLRRQIVQRAHDRCEYCGLAQAGQEAIFHVDHIIPRTAGGKTIASNLALACVSCSLRKADRLNALDPQSGKSVRLFNPRRDVRRLHFRWQGMRLVGISPVGRATVSALRVNRATALAIRQEEVALHRHPPLGHL